MSVSSLLAYFDKQAKKKQLLNQKLDWGSQQLRSELVYILSITTLTGLMPVRRGGYALQSAGWKNLGNGVTYCMRWQKSSAKKFPTSFLTSTMSYLNQHIRTVKHDIASKRNSENSDKINKFFFFLQKNRTYSIHSILQDDYFVYLYITIPFS